MCSLVRPMGTEILHSPGLSLLRKPVWLEGTWLGEQTASFYKLEKGTPSFRGLPLSRDQILGLLG